MTEYIRCLIQRLADGASIRQADFTALLSARDDETAQLLASLAIQKRKQYFGNTVYVRGLIEISNICKNDCFYCGIRATNTACERYRLQEDDILACCAEGYHLGLRTFVLQGGEDVYFTDARLVPLIREIKERYPDCALTLSLGERCLESYRLLKEAGADRYLLRHETADPEHYSALHPKQMSFAARIQCLMDLKTLGYQVGCGFMVGSPYQTEENLAKDLAFVSSFKPQMCGIGPFIPHKETPFAAFSAGDADLTCYLLSILRLIHPPMLIPATTALSTLAPNGRERGILAGANVVMPNLTPQQVRDQYSLYNNKANSGAEAAAGLDELRRRMQAIGYEIVTARGDYPSESK